MWVKHMVMPYLSQQLMTSSSRMEPPGSAIYLTPLRKARSILSLKGKKASLPGATLWRVLRDARFSASVRGSGRAVNYFCQMPSSQTSSSFWLM